MEIPSQECNSLGRMQSTQLDEFQKIVKNNPVLASTGCTRQFCQAGRMIHSDEPRVGETRPLKVVMEEASAFLWQLLQEGVYTEDQYKARRNEVLQSLEASAVVEEIWMNEVRTIGETATWIQTSEELLHGLRLAWKNSRKCIMRSHFRQLELCDLRHINTSIGMVTTVIDEVAKAFNKGQIKPTVFVFPPRSTRGTGPMFWSKQLLNFAGYQLEDGSVMGDPSNVQITHDILELGWVPPCPKSNWDLLPIVAMAENDAPAWADLPDELCELVEVKHPKFPANFQKLNLKWYQFPALSRLGFDIGGVQYTAAPFIGWYMDAEIGVRNLADTCRYNALPEVAKAIGFNIKSYKENAEYAEVESLEDLPDYEQLLWMSRAQTELNYAVRWSFLQKGVSCVGTLAASSDWTRFDDEHALKYGYRLNSDPYWIAPPQGSLIPLWHRGGSPNYQPKPLIARHRLDPVKSWRRRCDVIDAMVMRVVKCGTNWVSERVTPSVYHDNMVPENVAGSPTSDITLSIQSTVHIYYCSTGTTALKLAGKLRKRVKELPGNFQIVFNILNYLDIRKIEFSDLVLIVASTTGDGCFPANGADFEAAMNEMSQKYYEKSFPVRFSIFGVGDSGYPTFNAAAIKLYEFMKTVGGVPIASGLVKGNIAVEPLPLSSFNRWWGTIECSLTGNGNIIEMIEDEYVEQQRMLKTFKTGKLLAKYPSETKDERIIMILLELGNVDYLEMSHLRLLPWNASTQVSRAISALGVGGNGQLIRFTDPRLQPWSYTDFFQYFVDLEGKFKDLRWLSKIPSREDSLDPNGTVVEVLECLPMLRKISDELRVEICLNMPLLHPRSFSVASSAQYIGRGRVEVMVKVHRGGRFSDIFLSATDAGAPMKYSLVSKIPGRDLVSSDKPLIAICTGTGFAPIRSLLQKKIYNSKQTEAPDNPSQSTNFSISLFLGFKICDQAIFNDVVFEASRYGMIDMLFLVPSNEQKKRVQEYVEDNKDSILTKIREGSIYVCGGTAMVRDIARMLSKMIGEDVRQRLGRRYVEEVF